ncbi:MAG TPA: outer membrane beta-barrel protein [Candidatus Kryptonia bacterium]|nr:outer membrane beta-barrel protein [Candidatus Kryptonia bacterium]
MRRFLIVMALLAGVPAAGAADRDSGGDRNQAYYTLGLTSLVVGPGGCSCDNFNLGAIAGAVGWQPIGYLAIEGTGLIGVLDQTKDGVTLRLDSGFMVSALPMVPINRSVAIYGRVGYAETLFRASANGFNLGSSSNHDIGYGLGVQWLTTPAGVRSEVGACLEVDRYYEKQGVKVDGATISFIQRF